MKEIVIDLARDFSPRPWGRGDDDSRRSATAFRENQLAPAISAFDRVTVDLSGTTMISSSFLDEVFRGLIEKDQLPPATLRDKLVVVHNRLPSIVKEAWLYMGIDQLGNDAYGPED